MILLGSVIFWIVLPALNFLIFFYLGRQEYPLNYFQNDCSITPPIIIKAEPCPTGMIDSNKARIIHSLSVSKIPVPDCRNHFTTKPASIKAVNADRLSQYRNEDLVKITYPGWATMVNAHEKDCESFVNPTLGNQKECIAIVHANTRVAHNLLRFDYYNKKVKIAPLVTKSQQLFPTGFFKKVGNAKGRRRLIEKMGPLFLHFKEIFNYVDIRLWEHGLKAGDDVVVMVTNDGEMDLFLNFACSCRFHNITLHNVIVFAGSSDILPIIAATGAIGLYHKSFASVSPDASTAYLDKVFIDMMWYKAFSVWLILRSGMNVLFQDVDLVWFRDPFPYFHEYIRTAAAKSATGSHPDSFFSDDGQRSLRYTPFYANSGFFYLLCNPRTTHFAWSVMTSFDVLQTTGSHQNVFTFRLNEQIDLAGLHPKLLDIRLFPTGIMHHHDKVYMRNIKRGIEKPYGFHMCWTAGKSEKIDYFREALMWYMKESCGLGPISSKTGIIHRRMSRLQLEMAPVQQQWNQLAGFCCQALPGAP